MNTRNQLIATWCTPVAMTLLGVALITLAKFIPPPSPTMPAIEVATHFREHATEISIAMLLILFSGTLLAPMTAVYSLQIRRIEGSASILTYTQLITGTVALMLFIMPAIFWVAAAYRPERAAETVLLLNDLGWLFFLMTVPPGMLQVLILGVAILSDKRKDPIFPRWVGYLNLWLVIILMPSGLIPLFKTGPFAWDGLIAFWIPLPFFGCWWWIMFFMCLKAIRKSDENI